MEKILLMPQQAKFFSKRAERKNAFDIIIAFHTDAWFDAGRFDEEVNRALELSKIGYLRMSERPFMGDEPAVYRTGILEGVQPAGEDLEQAVDRVYLEAIRKIDVGAGRFMAGYLDGSRLYLIFNHLVFDLEGVICFFDEIAHIAKFQPVNCTANPNELVKLIQTKAEGLTDDEMERPWAGREIRNFMVELPYPNPVESDMRMSGQVLLTGVTELPVLESNLVSPTSGKNKGVMYLLVGALLAANWKLSGDGRLFGHFNHTYSGIPCFNRFTNVITWKVAGVPFIFDFYTQGMEKDAPSYLARIKRDLDVCFNEGYKMDVMRQRKSNPDLLAKLESPIMLFNFRSEMAKLEKKAHELGLEMIEGGYDYVPRLFPYPARHLFDLNFNKYADGLSLSIQYSSRNYTEGFVDRFLELFREEYAALAERCREPVFAGRSGRV